MGPIFPREIYLFKLSKRIDIKISTLEEAKHYTIGSMRESASTKQLLDSGFTEQKNLWLVTDETQNLRRLLAKRIDLATFSKMEVAWRLQQLSQPTKTKLLQPAYLFSGEYQYYIAFNKQVPDTIITKLPKELDNMKQDGRYDAILRKYGVTKQLFEINSNQ